MSKTIKQNAKQIKKHVREYFKEQDTNNVIQHENIYLHIKKKTLFRFMFLLISIFILYIYVWCVSFPFSDVLNYDPSWQVVSFIVISTIAAVGLFAAAVFYLLQED